MFNSIILLNRNLRVLFDRLAHEQGLTYARARLLSTIARNEGSSQSELADILGIETPTLKRQLDALESQGLAERRLLPSDARKYAIYLTAAAHEKTLLTFREEMESQLIEGLPEEDVATARRVLAHLVTRAKALDEK